MRTDGKKIWSSMDALALADEGEDQFTELLYAFGVLGSPLKRALALQTVKVVQRLDARALADLAEHIRQLQVQSLDS